jgi:hypothetical protein
LFVIASSPCAAFRLRVMAFRARMRDARCTTEGKPAKKSGRKMNPWKRRLRLVQTARLRRAPAIDTENTEKSEKKQLVFGRASLMRHRVTQTACAKGMRKAWLAVPRPLSLRSFGHGLASLDGGRTLHRPTRIDSSVVLRFLGVLRVDVLDVSDALNGAS